MASKGGLPRFLTPMLKLPPTLLGEKKKKKGFLDEGEKSPLAILPPEANFFPAITGSPTNQSEICPLWPADHKIENWAFLCFRIRADGETPEKILDGMRKRLQTAVKNSVDIIIISVTDVDPEVKEEWREVITEEAGLSDGTHFSLTEMAAEIPAFEGIFEILIAQPWRGAVQDVSVMVGTGGGYGAVVEGDGSENGLSKLGKNGSKMGENDSKMGENSPEMMANPPQMVENGSQMRRNSSGMMKYSTKMEENILLENGGHFDLGGNSVQFSPNSERNEVKMPGDAFMCVRARFWLTEISFVSFLGGGFVVARGACVGEIEQKPCFMDNDERRNPIQNHFTVDHETVSDTQLLAYAKKCWQVQKLNLCLHRLKTNQFFNGSAVFLLGLPASAKRLLERGDFADRQLFENIHQNVEKTQQNVEKTQQNSEKTQQNSGKTQQNVERTGEKYQTIDHKSNYPIRLLQSQTRGIYGLQGTGSLPIAVLDPWQNTNRRHARFLDISEVRVLALGDIGASGAGEEKRVKDWEKMGESGEEREKECEKIEENVENCEKKCEKMEENDENNGNKCEKIEPNIGNNEKNYGNMGDNDEKDDQICHKDSTLINYGLEITAILSVKQIDGPSNMLGKNEEPPSPLVCGRPRPVIDLSPSVIHLPPLRPFEAQQAKFVVSNISTHFIARYQLLCLSRFATRRNNNAPGMKLGSNKQTIEQTSEKIEQIDQKIEKNNQKMEENHQEIEKNHQEIEEKHQNLEQTSPNIERDKHGRGVAERSSSGTNGQHSGNNELTPTKGGDYEEIFPKNESLRKKRREGSAVEDRNVEGSKAIGTGGANRKEGEESTENAEEIGQNRDKIEENTDNIEENTDKIEENTETFEGDIHKIEENTAKIEENTNKIEKNTEKLSENTDTTEENTDKIEENTDKIEENTDKIEKITDKTEENRHETVEKVENIDWPHDGSCSTEMRSPPERSLTRIEFFKKVRSMLSYDEDRPVPLHRNMSRPFEGWSRRSKNGGKGGEKEIEKSPKKSKKEIEKSPKRSEKEIEKNPKKSEKEIEKSPKKSEKEIEKSAKKKKTKKPQKKAKKKWKKTQKKAKKKSKKTQKTTKRNGKKKTKQQGRKRREAKKKKKPLKKQ